ncbi:hypothetical protein BDP81DRAFT_114150 [Colletotrichum phormii]|uniref:Secreted protein n=1 Tax=Colletotrichum phormii TaxID=359342 RepID=A0AAJ0E9F9_9PEZI|nr:uncharacterized protein BDP81DRAFT_114150 [Colletotrichum phormii]KAK1623909.1 hypothetical protein BDP81DRAFT_114150 [Colletotrichum phormii]
MMTNLTTLIQNILSAVFTLGAIHCPSVSELMIAFLISLPRNTKNGRLAGPTDRWVPSPMSEQSSIEMSTHDGKLWYL